MCSCVRQTNAPACRGGETGFHLPATISVDAGVAAPECLVDSPRHQFKLVCHARLKELVIFFCGQPTCHKQTSSQRMVTYCHVDWERGKGTAPKTCARRRIRHHVLTFEICAVGQHGRRKHQSKIRMTRMAHIICTLESPTGAVPVAQDPIHRPAAATFTVATPAQFTLTLLTDMLTRCRPLAAHGAWSYLSVRTQPLTATGAPSQTSTIPYHIHAEFKR